MQEDGDKLSDSMTSFVKVRMDGASYLGKVDLKMYKSYQELSMALLKMFGSFTNTVILLNIYYGSSSSLTLWHRKPWKSARTEAKGSLQFPCVISGLTFAMEEGPICIPFNLVVDLSGWMNPTTSCMHPQPVFRLGWSSVSCLH